MTEGSRDPRTDQVGIGLVGLDHWYAALPLVGAISANESARLVVIYDQEPGRAEGVAQQHGIQNVASNWHDVVNNAAVDVVMSFASVDQNPEICVAAAAAGKHIVSIKPLARTLDEANAVVAAVQRAGVHFLPSESRWRLHERFTAVRDWHLAGRGGQMCNATMTIWAGLPQSWPDDKDPGWFIDPKRTIGGAWADHAIYQIDQLRWILGEDVASISGVTANRFHPDLELEDYGVSVVTFSGGFVATLENTWTAPTGGFQSSSRLVGSKGAIDLNGITDRQLTIGEDLPAPGWSETRQPPPRNPAIDVEHIIEVASGTAQPIATVTDAWDNLAACLAFYESARSGQAVSPERRK